MPTYTNKYNIPSRIIRMLPTSHRPVEGRYSVTDLVADPLPRTLLLEKWDELIIDYADMLLVVQGIALHEKAEKAVESDEEAETKFEDVIDGVTIVGKADNYIPAEKTIVDTKQTGVWSPTYPDWIAKVTAQLNCYASQRLKRDYLVKKLVADVFYRDHSITKSLRTQNYPPIAYQEIEITLWPFEKQEQYIKDQIELHTINAHKECSMVQKMQRFNVKKKGRITPLKVCDTFLEAQIYVENYVREEGIKPNLVTAELSEPLACMYYCKARSCCPYAKRLSK